MKLDKKQLLLYAVTDRAWLRGNSLASQVEQAVKAGVTFVQLREKGLGFDDFLSQAKAVKQITDRYGVPFVINDNVEVALACHADGVHVGQEDMQAQKARELLGPDKIIGVSAHSVEEALAAERAGADYLGVGAAFSTSTKPEAGALPHTAFREICRAVQIPVVAIGGIQEDNIMQLAGAGLAGVAVVSAIFAQEDIPAAVKRLHSCVERMVSAC